MMELAEPQVFSIQAGRLRGTLADDDGQLDREAVRRRGLILTPLSVVNRVVRNLIPYLGPVPESDPCIKLLSPKADRSRPLALLPVTLSNRIICICIFQVRRPFPSFRQGGTPDKYQLGLEFASQIIG